METAENICEALRIAADESADESAVEAVDVATRVTLVPVGLKFDGGKIPWELIPEDAIEAVARVLQFGAKKYAARNWERGIVYSRLYGAMRRHGKAWFQDREDLDPETGLPHLAHLACEVLFALAFELRGQTELDDRPHVKSCKPVG